ncbi:hypothetical protein [Sphingopyxis sp. YF1]|uniref:hypothetical protein n=1 Tax=Sphingopyxis sp. YF1 TaxID=2482763 RepID=UPI001F612853|nr:hypothetical protein [Sphingopyxis sp. YF1]
MGLTAVAIKAAKGRDKQYKMSDSGGLWSLKPGKDEELSSFFVAFTRAEQRAFFTSCRERGGGIPLA